MPVDAGGGQARNQLLALSADHGGLPVRPGIPGLLHHLSRGRRLGVRSRSHAAIHRHCPGHGRRAGQRVEAHARAAPAARAAGGRCLVDRARPDAPLAATRARETHPESRRIQLRGLCRERGHASPTAAVNRLPGGLALALFCLMAAVCATASAAPPTRETRDDTGLTVAVRDAPCRIVSLAPGTTAMLYAAGAGGCLIGTIAHSNEPAEAASVPVVGDAETLDFERLLALRPTVVVVAVDVVQRVRIDRIRSLGIPV